MCHCNATFQTPDHLFPVYHSHFTALFPFLGSKTNEYNWFRIPGICIDPLDQTIPHAFPRVKV
jgi:hypothetical protein